MVVPGVVLVVPASRQSHMRMESCETKHAKCEIRPNKILPARAHVLHSSPADFRSFFDAMADAEQPQQQMPAAVQEPPLKMKILNIIRFLCGVGCISV